MKKIMICICAVVFMLSLFGCEDSLSNNIINLNTETIEVDEDTYEILCERNETKFINNFFIIGTYDEYINFYSSATKKDIEPLDKESGDKLFENQVILCFPRIVSYSRNFIQVKYEYNENDSNINVKHLYESEDDIDYPCVVVAYCFDLVKVSKDICNKIVYNIVFKCEHDFHEVIIDKNPDSDIKKIEETCIKCGYKKIGYVLINPILYSITTIGDTEYLKDISSYNSKAENEIIIETCVLIDADIEVLINGVKIEKDVTLSTDESWYYKFIMPNEDVTVEIKVISSNSFYLDAIYNTKLIASFNVGAYSFDSLKVEDQILYGSSILYKDIKIGELLYNSTGGIVLKEFFNIDEFTYSSPEGKEIVAELFNKEDYYSVPIASIPESAPSYILIELNNELYFISMLSNISLGKSLLIYKLI